jgi:hypothetical protein
LGLGDCKINFYECRSVLTGFKDLLWRKSNMKVLPASVILKVIPETLLREIVVVF